MPQRGKSTTTDKKKRQAGATDKGYEQKVVARPEPKARAWPAVNNLPGGGKKFNSRHKVPSGPVGGSGRKTNLGRST